MQSCVDDATPARVCVCECIEDLTKNFTHFRSPHTRTHRQHAECVYTRYRCAECRVPFARSSRTLLVEHCSAAADPQTAQAESLNGEPNGKSERCTLCSSPRRQSDRWRRRSHRLSHRPVADVVVRLSLLFPIYLAVLIANMDFSTPIAIGGAVCKASKRIETPCTRLNEWGKSVAAADS